MNTQTTKIEYAFDGFYYPMVLDGTEYEYIWDDNGNEIRFSTSEGAANFLASYGRVA